MFGQPEMFGCPSGVIQGNNWCPWLQVRYDKTDVTQAAKCIVQGIQAINASPRSNFTLLHCIEVFKGHTHTSSVLPTNIV